MCLMVSFLVSCHLHHYLFQALAGCYSHRQKGADQRPSARNESKGKRGDGLLGSTRDIARRGLSRGVGAGGGPAADKPSVSALSNLGPGGNRAK